MNTKKHVRPDNLKRDIVKFCEKLEFIYEKDEKRNIKIGYSKYPTMVHIAYCTKEGDYVLYDNDLEVIEDKIIEKLYEDKKDAIDKIRDQKRPVKEDIVEQTYRQFKAFTLEYSGEIPEKLVALFFEDWDTRMNYKTYSKYFSARHWNDLCSAVRATLGLPQIELTHSYAVEEVVVEDNRTKRKVVHKRDSDGPSHLDNFINDEKLNSKCNYKYTKPSLPRKCPSDDQKQPKEQCSNVKPLDDQKQRSEDEDDELLVMEGAEISLKSEIQR